MAIFMICYDLHEGEDYENLIDAIKTYGTWWHHLDSTWLIETDSTTTEIADYLFPHMLKGDKLLVIRYGKDGAAWRGAFSDRAEKWLKDTL